MPELLESHRDVPLVAISESQRRFFPDQRWVATIHHGLPLDAMPFEETHGDYLAFVGLGLREDDVVFGAAPLAHVLGMSGCMR